MRCVTADDSRISRDMLRRILRDGGHEVVGQAANGKEAVDLCREHKPDIAILDLSMPVLTGNEAAQVIVSEKIAGRVVIVSSMNQNSTRASLEAIGCTFIAKPYDSVQIIRVLDEHS